MRARTLLVLALVLAPLGAPAAAGAAPPTITLGIGRDRDVATYNVTGAWSEYWQGTRLAGSDLQDGEERHQHVLVLQPARIADGGGNARETVRLDELASIAEGWEPLRSAYVDAATRSIVRHDTFGSAKRGLHPLWLGEQLPGEALSVTTASSAFGPEFAHDAPLATVPWYPLLLQGLTFTQGDAWPALAEARERQVDAPPPLTPWVEDIVHANEHRAWVGERGLRGGVEVWAFEVRSHVDVEYPEWDDYRYQTWLNATLWYSAGDAWPLRIDVASNWSDLMDGRLHYAWEEEKTYELARLDAEGETLRLGAHDLAALPAPAPHVRPAPGAAFPASGEGWTRYRIEAALAAVESDLTLVHYRLWKAQHPGARLVGAEFWTSVEGTDLVVPGIGRWRLWYAQPGGSTAWSVTSTRDGTGSITNREAPRAVELPEWARFRPEDLPQQLISFDALDRQWAAYDPEGHARGLSILVWGVTASTIQGSVDARMSLRTGWAVHRSSQDPAGLVARLQGAWGSFQSATASMETGELRVGFSFGHALDHDGVVPLRVTDPLDIEPLQAREDEPSPIVPIAAASLLGLAALLAYFAPLLRQALVVAFTRLTRAAVLENDVRDALLARIREAPGVSPPELHRELGGGWSTVVYHLGVLEREGFVTSLLDGRHRRYFPAGIDQRLRAPLSALRNARTRQTYELLRARPGLERAQVAGALGVTTPGALFHLQRLESAGLLETRRDGRRVLYAARESELVRAAVGAGA